jgi:hypothetical protein
MSLGGEKVDYAKQIAVWLWQQVAGIPGLTRVETG